MTTDPDRPRVLLVTRNLPPLLGGMERLNWHMAEELSKIADVKIVGPVGCKAIAPPSVTVHEVPLQPLWKFLLYAHKSVREQARSWKPQVVLAGSGLTAPLSLSAAKLARARAYVYVHGLDVAVNHPIYRYLWFPAIRRMDCIIANSRPTLEICKKIGVKQKKIHVVNPGVLLPAPLSGPDKLEAIANFRRHHNIGDRPLLLSVGRLSTRKGLSEFVSHALPLIAADRPDVLLMVVGETPEQALHAQAQTPEAIQAAADASGVGSNIRFVGAIRDYNELGNAYRAANIHVFPIRNLVHDPEGFGMVAIEAAAHGLKTIAFATGGVIDAVSEGNSGHLIQPDDYDAFARKIIEELNNRKPDDGACERFAASFSWPEFGKKIEKSLNLRQSER